MKPSYLNSFSLNMEERKFCVVCGMPLNNVEDYPEGADLGKVDWCKYCGTKDDIYPYDLAIENMTNFIKDAQGLNDDDARKAAEEYIKGSVAYKEGRFN